MAKMYGILPSKVLAEATTFDIMVMDVMMTWEQQQQDKAAGKPTTPKIPQAQLQEIIAKHRKEYGQGNNTQIG